MLVWVASYPRSGNAFARRVLARSLRAGRLIDTRELRDGPEVDAGVLSEIRLQDETAFVKTHFICDAADSAPAIYLVRDGRDCVTSYAHFAHTHDVDWKGSSFEDTAERLIVNPEPAFGGWSANVRAWKDRSGPTAIVSFERMIARPMEVLEEALRSLGVPWKGRSREPESFEQLKRLSPKYRRGEVGSWASELPERLEQLFWDLHGDEMVTMGYDRDHGRD